jgi:redox-regulated HSP33 family molecular chaperone
MKTQDLGNGLYRVTFEGTKEQMQNLSDALSYTSNSLPENVEGDEYRSVHDLTQDELEELRATYFYQLLETDSEVLGDIESEDELPMDVVIAHYEDVSFVKEDFFCNL